MNSPLSQQRRLYPVISALLFMCIACDHDTPAVSADSSAGITFGVSRGAGVSRGDAVADFREMALSGNGDSLPLYATVIDRIYPALTGRGTPSEDVSDFRIYSHFYRSESSGVADAVFFADEPVVRDGSDTWTTNTTYYWPTAPGSALTFWAFDGYGAPGVTVVPSEEGPESMAIDYVVPSQPSRQADLMLAVTGRVNGHAVPAYRQPLVFSHLCSAVTFVTGKEVQGGAIRSITLTGIMSEGRYTGSWNSLRSPMSFTIDEVRPLTGNEQQGEALHGRYNTLMMIPQILGPEAKLTVEFDDNVTGLTRTLSASLAGHIWRQGTTTVYNIGITPGFTLEFTEQPAECDAHYVMCPTGVKVSGIGADREWSLRVVASDGAPASIMLTSALNQFAQRGFWTDCYMNNGTPPMRAHAAQPL